MPKDKEGKTVNQKRKRRKKTRKAVGFFICFLLLVAVAFCVLSLTVFFKAETVKVVGNSVYTAEEILDTADIKAGDNIFAISESRLSERLEKKLPFIKSVTLERKLPDLLTVKVEETAEEVCFKHGNNYYSADFDGKILKCYKAEPTALTVITVSPKTDFKVGEIIKYATELEGRVVGKYLSAVETYKFDVNFINVSDVYDTYMKVESRFIVKFGSVSDFEYKAAHLDETLKAMKENSTGIIDLRVWSNDKPKAYFTEQSISSVLE